MYFISQIPYTQVWITQEPVRFGDLSDKLKPVQFVEPLIESA
ncbi:MAG: hypothetical protein UY04_C0012G0018 [Parcubacteria group bacterium GW2011_GWA2_47_7]|nr:MAG: hypothetical protein UY04_C0012G0018 [Parcubacteria group bacterium GW2011_GWA2_47_7]